MLKITTRSEATLTKLVLEGRLAGPWVDELDRCWREVAGTQQNHVAVDLTGVTFIDPEGKALLTRMWQQGAKFHAVGCLTKCIVEDVTKAGAPVHPVPVGRTTTKGAKTLMLWLVVYMTVIFPLLLVVLLVMDLVEFETKALESPLTHPESE